MADPRKEFETALLVERVASRYAMEFDSKGEMDAYLKEHPDADRSNHSVKKQAPKGKAPALDPSRVSDDHPSLKIKDKDGKNPIWIRKDLEGELKKYLKKNPNVDVHDAAQAVKKNYQANRLKDLEKAKKKPETKPEAKKPESKPEAKSDDKPKSKAKSDPFEAGGKFDSDDKPSSKEYVAAVEDALVSKNKWGWRNPGDVKEFMGKFNKLDDSSKRELAWRLIEEEHDPEGLASEFFKK